MKKRLIGLALALVMVFSLSAFADGPGEGCDIEPGCAGDLPIIIPVCPPPDEGCD